MRELLKTTPLLSRECRRLRRLGRAGRGRDNRNAKSGLKRKLRTGTLHSLCIGHHSKIRPCLRAGYCTGALADGRASDTGIPHSSFIIPRDTLPTGRVSACAVKGRMRIKSDEPPLLTYVRACAGCALAGGRASDTDIHRSPFTTHHSPLTTHHSPFTTHHSPLTTHHSPFTIHHSPLTIHHSPFSIHYSPFPLPP